MAKVTEPAGDSQLRRGIGPLEYLSINDRHTVRQRGKQAHRPGHHDGVILAQTNAIMHLWQSMSDEERALWGPYAAINAPLNWLGVPKRWTSYHAFMAVNSSGSHGGEPPIVEPPDEDRPGIPILDSVLYTGTTIVLQWTAAPPAYTSVGVRIAACPIGRERVPFQRCTRRATWYDPTNATIFSHTQAGRHTIWYAQYGATCHLYSPWSWITLDLVPT